LFRADGDLLVDGLGVESDLHGDCAGGEAECLGVGGEAGEGWNGERERAGVEVGEKKISRGVGGGLGDQVAIRASRRTVAPGTVAPVGSTMEPRTEGRFCA